MTTKCLKCPNVVRDGSYKFCLDCERKPSAAPAVVLKNKDAIPSFTPRPPKEVVCHMCGKPLLRDKKGKAICLDCRNVRMKERAPKYYKAH